jgi:hypothetical protein
MYRGGTHECCWAKCEQTFACNKTDNGICVCLCVSDDDNDKVCSMNCQTKYKEYFDKQKKEEDVKVKKKAKWVDKMLHPKTLKKQF